MTCWPPAARSPALLAPVGVLLGRLAGGTHGRWIAGVGIAAAVVQVVGLSRWFLFVPGLSADALVPAKTADAQHTFELLHTWLAVLGYVSAALIATGVLIPLGVEVASLSNFVGYVAWCLWLIAMAVLLWRAEPRRAGQRVVRSARLRQG
jgi:hypothetical protein